MHVYWLTCTDTIHAYIEKQNLFLYQAHETLYVKARQLDWVCLQWPRGGNFAEHYCGKQVYPGLGKMTTKSMPFQNIWYTSCEDNTSEQCCECADYTIMAVDLTQVMPQVMLARLSILSLLYTYPGPRLWHTKHARVVQYEDTRSSFQYEVALWGSTS